MSDKNHYELLGFQAAKDGMKVTDNPYGNDESGNGFQWFRGFCEGKNQSVPEVGCKGYYSIGTDTYPITVVKVSKSGKKIWVRYETFVGDKEAGHDYFGSQKWKITENPNGKIEAFYFSEKRKRYQSGGSGSIGLTGWMARQDPSF